MLASNLQRAACLCLPKAIHFNFSPDNIWNNLWRFFFFFLISEFSSCFLLCIYFYFYILHSFFQVLHLLDCVFLYFFKRCMCFLFKGFYLFTCVILYLFKEVIMSYLMSSIVFMIWDFRYNSCFSGVWRYLGLAVVGELGFDATN